MDSHVALAREVEELRAALETIRVATTEGRITGAGDVVWLEQPGSKIAAETLHDFCVRATNGVDS